MIAVYQQQNFLLTTKLFCLSLFTFSDAASLSLTYFLVDQDGSLLDLEIYITKRYSPLDHFLVTFFNAHRS